MHEYFPLLPVFLEARTVSNDPGVRCESSRWQVCWQTLSQSTTTHRLEGLRELGLWFACDKVCRFRDGTMAVLILMMLQWAEVDEQQNHVLKRANGDVL